MRKFTVKAARSFADLTQDELADKMGVSRSSISAWENNQKTMTKSHLIAFCTVTGFKEEEIFLPMKST